MLATVPEDRWRDLWPDGAAPVQVDRWELDGPAPDGARLVVLPYMGGTRGLDRLTEVARLEVVQTLTAGYEHVLPFVPGGVTLCTAAGVHDASTAELAVGLAIAALRGLADFARAANTGTWLAMPRPSLADRRVLLIGAGQVGSAIAARLAPFEVELTRVASRAREDGSGHVHGIDEVEALLPRHDVVILAVPLSPVSRGLVNASFLAAMPDGALLVNVARGQVVDTDALVAEVSSGRLLAALDVTDPEPLPPGHPLWTAPGVLISPHVGGNSSAFEPRAKALLRDQFQRFAAGVPLRNVVAGPAR